MRRLRPYIGPLIETGWVSAGQVFAFIGGIIGIKVLTNMMPPEHYGEFSLGISVAGIINMMLFGPLSQIVMRYYSVCRERGELGRYVIVLVRLHRQAVALLLFTGAWVAFGAAILLDRHWSLLVLAAIVFGALTGLQGSASSLLNALRDRKNAAMTQGLDTWLRLGFSIALVWGMGSQGYWAVCGYILGAGVILVLQYGALRRQDVGNVFAPLDDVHVAALRDELMRYGVPFFAFAGLGAVSQYADRWLLQSFIGTDAVGIYAAMFQIASAPITFLMGVVTQLVIPIVFSRFGNLENHGRAHAGQSLLYRSSLVVGTLYAFITITAYVWGGSLIVLLTNADYARYSDAFWMIVLSQALFNLGQLMVASGLSLNRPQAYLVPKFGQAFSLLVFGLIFVKQWGVTGMALALLLSSVAYFVWVNVVNVGLWKEHGRLNEKLG